jgi:hypothetical protein
MIVIMNSEGCNLHNDRDRFRHKIKFPESLACCERRCEEQTASQTSFQQVAVKASLKDCKNRHTFPRTSIYDVTVRELLPHPVGIRQD